MATGTSSSTSPASSASRLLRRLTLRAVRLIPAPLPPVAAGANPAAELAFNAGAHPILSLCTRGKLCPHQTYTSGENHTFNQKTKKGKGKLLTPKNFPAPEGVVWHLLLPVGKGWGAGEESRFDLATLRDRVDHINAEGGAITLDVPITGAGVIPAAVLRVLKGLGKDIDKLTDGARSF